jgi:hypothetical protein
LLYLCEHEYVQCCSYRNFPRHREMVCAPATCRPTTHWADWHRKRYQGWRRGQSAHAIPTTALSSEVNVHTKPSTRTQQLVAVPNKTICTFRFWHSNNKHEQQQQHEFSTMPSGSSAHQCALPWLLSSSTANPCCTPTRTAKGSRLDDTEYKGRGAPVDVVTFGTGSIDTRPNVYTCKKNRKEKRDAIRLTIQPIKKRRAERKGILPPGMR